MRRHDPTMKQHDITMMLQTPFHSRIVKACEINQWDDWRGYTTPNAFTDIEQEYFVLLVLGTQRMLYRARNCRQYLQVYKDQSKKI